MPFKKQKFSIVNDNLVQAIDVDDSMGRSVPINMNFIENGYLSKDTGFSLSGATETSQMHSLYNFEKKDGTSKLIRALGTKIQLFNTGTGLWADIVVGGTATISIATPGVVTKTAHGFGLNSKVVFSTTGALPTGITAGTTYYVISTGLTADAFQFSTTLGGSAVTTSGSQSGTHTVQKLYTADNRFCYITDSANDIMYGSNGIDTVWSWNGTTFTDVVAVPKGVIMEIFEQRLYVSGVTAEPLTVYYSKPADFGNFTVSATEGGLFKPLGSDTITQLKNYYGFLIVFKQRSIWKMTLVEVTTGIFVPKQELQSNNYGACSRYAVVWVENDLWFCTGREVRAFGFKDQVTGVLGVNDSIISEPIKETLKLVTEANFPYVFVHYNNRRFYLSVSLSSVTPTLNDTLFVCHNLYSNAWTKYAGRDKSKCLELYSIKTFVYSIKNLTPFSVIKWDNTLLNDNGTAIYGIVTFKKIEDKDFNLFNIYRYLDLMLKNLVGNITVTILQDKSDLRTSQSKSFEIGQV